MSTYLNAHEMLKEVRYGLDDYSDEKLKGTDTTSVFQNDYLMRKINSAQQRIYSVVFTRKPSLFLESAELTGVDSVYTLPWDFGAIDHFNDDRGRQVHPIRTDALKLEGSVGSDRLYYRKGNTLVLDQSGITDTYTLWYFRKPRNLDQGTAVSGTTNVIQLAESAPKRADYFNGMTIENVTQDWVSTVSDYTAERVATVVGTAEEFDYYGIVSDLPEEFHELVVKRAILEVKAQHPAAKTPPTPAEVQFFNDQLDDVIAAYTGDERDVDPEDIWTDFDSYPYVYYY